MGTLAATLSPLLYGLLVALNRLSAALSPSRKHLHHARFAQLHDPSLRSVVNGRGLGRDFRALVRVAGRRVPTAGSRRGWGQPTARIGLGFEMSSFFRIAASSGLIRLA